MSRLAQCHVQRHHQGEAQGEGQRSHIGVLPLGHLRDQFLHHHIEHGAGGEAKQIGQGRGHQPGGQDGQPGAQGFHRTGEHTPRKGPDLAPPPPAEAWR